MTSSELDVAGYSVFTAVLLSRNPGGEFGGYQSRYFISPIEVLCVFCRQIPRSPHHVACGHVFCRDCLFNNVLVQEQVCCQCNRPIRREDCVPDIQLARRVSQSSICCPYSRECQWAGYIADVSVHFSECPYVSALIRSWMQSIQAHLSAVATETARTERRVDRLAEQVRQMETKCDAACHEHEGKLGWIGNQLDYFKHEILGSPLKRSLSNRPNFDFNPATPPQPQPEPTPQRQTGKFGIHIDESQLTESLIIDLQGARPAAAPERGNRPPSRNVSNYEDYVIEDTGDLELPTMDDSPFAGPTYAYPPFQPDLQPPYAPPMDRNKVCLYCNNVNMPGATRCGYCAKVL